MHRIVNSLPREYKVPFSMHVSGFKYREIAEKLGLPLGTVKAASSLPAKTTTRTERFCLVNILYKIKNPMGLKYI